MGTPGAVLRAWFEAHAARDLDRARSMLDEAALIRVGGVELRGFDAFMAWYEARRTAQPSFTYEVLDILEGVSHAAAVIPLTDGDVSWRQIAIYEIEDGVIREMTAYEDDATPRRVDE